MIDIEVFHRISYGLYVVCSGDSNLANGFISNTVFQVTAEPPKFVAACNKNNYTAEFIIRHQAFTVSVLSVNAPAELFGRFGYRSGRDFNKLEGIAVKYGSTGVPILTWECIAYLEFKLVETIDAGTHWLFMGQLIESGMLDEHEDPMTYRYYREVRKGIAPKNAPTYIDPQKSEINQLNKMPKRFKCPACGYIYDENIEKIKFDDLPDNWICPVCGSEKSDFIEIIP